MATPNSNYTDLTVATLEYRNPKIIDAVTGNNAALAYLKKNGGWKVIDGGHKIIEPIQFAQNGNGGWYSGYDQLPVGPQEILTEAEFAWKQLAVPVVASGLETDVQNTGEEALHDLLEERITNAEYTAANLTATSFFSDGTGSAGKEITGVKAMLSATPTTGTYGGINRATSTNTWWRNKFTDTGANPSSTTIQGLMNTMWYSLVRGADKPDLILVDDDVMGAYEASVQTLQRFSDPGEAALGFSTMKYKTASIVMDGNCTDKTAYFLNTKFMRMRVAKNRNFKALPAQTAFNQDAQVVILAAALNLTCNNAYLLGRLEFTP
jgi:hypothetical protein